jgi:hypothetical protein
MVMATKWLQFEGIEKPSPRADWVFMVEANRGMANPQFAAA